MSHRVDLRCCRRLEAKVESVAREALGSRAGLVRGFRSCLGPAQGLADGVPGGGRLEVLVAAQVWRSARSPLKWLRGKLRMNAYIYPAARADEDESNSE